MTKETVLIVGLGEVGQTLYELFTGIGKFDVYGTDIDEAKTLKLPAGNKEIPKTIDVMHICFRCGQQANFAQTSAQYIEKFQPKLTIIDSTVPPGTTQKVYELSKSPVVHSPIRGMHETLESMKKDVKFWTKYVGGTTKEAAEEAEKHFQKVGLKVKVLRGSEETELAKLFETIYRAWMIACFQEMHRISRHYGADFDEVVDMLEDEHRSRLNKPLHYPGVIGGHCLVPNTQVLLSVYDSEFLRLILESNKKRKEEIKEQAIAREVERIKKRADALQEELMRKLSQR